MIEARAVLFDLDGTLCDRAAGWQRYLAAQHTRFHLKQVPLALYQTRALELEAQYRSQRLHVFQHLQAEFGFKVSPEALFADFRAHIGDYATLYEGAHGLLTALRAEGILLGVVTNGSTQAQMAKLETTGIAPLFQAILISEAEGVRKPDAILFEGAAHTLGVPVSECVFVGDDPVADVSGAKAAGMKAIWLSWGHTWPPELAFYPDAVSGNLLDVLVQVAPWEQKND